MTADDAGAIFGGHRPPLQNPFALQASKTKLSERLYAAMAFGIAA